MLGVMGWANVVMRTHDGPNAHVSPCYHTSQSVLIYVFPGLADGWYIVER